MKKLLLTATLLTSFLHASEPAYEITPLIGFNLQEGNTEIKDQALIGAEVQFNNLTKIIKPEFSVLYSQGDYATSDDSTDLYRLAFNGVYNIETERGPQPFIKAGVGYEAMSGPYQGGNIESVFVDAGAGFKLPLMDRLALKLETVYMLKGNNSRFDSNLALLVGLNISFGNNDAQQSMTQESTSEIDQARQKMQEDTATKQAQEAKAATLKAEQEERTRKQDEALAQQKAEEARAKAAQEATAAAMLANADDDSDGIANGIDQCEKTVGGLEVDKNGCALQRDFVFYFARKSSELDTDSQARLLELIPVLKTREFYNIKVIGHTDNRGNKDDNQALSQERAENIRLLLIQKGIHVDRLSVEGKGEMEPIADNATEEGKRVNRRIEIKLTNEAGIAAAALAAVSNGDDDNDGVLNGADLCLETKSNTKVDKDGCAQKRTLTLHFGRKSSKLDSNSETKILSLVPFLKEHSTYNVTLIGHTDNRGSYKDNQALSQARAEYVRALLADSGIAADRLSAEGKGEMEPIASNETVKGREKNRRIEVQLSK